MSYLGVFSNLDLLSVGIASAANIILGCVILFNGYRSVTNRTFLYFTLVTTFWGIVNYLNYRFTSPELVLWMLRLVLFGAVGQAFFIHQLFYVFPREKIEFSNTYKKLLIPLGIAVALLTLTPLVFKGIVGTFSVGQVAQVEKGPGIGLFGLFAVGLVGRAIYLLIKKIRNSNGEEKRATLYVFTGTFIMFALIIALNFILPAFLNNQRYIPLGALFTLPFTLFTAYAIMRHKLLNVKVVSTEVLVFVLAIAELFEIVISDSFPVVIFRSSIFVLTIGIGVLLIRSVINEVKQREQLQILTEQLKEANVKLEALDKARAEFISIASHQLRTPPATIKWYIGAVLSGDFGDLNEEVKSALERVQSTNNSQISLIDDLLNASRIERGKMEFFFEKADLAELARITYDQLLPQAKMRKIDLIYNVPTEPLPVVMMDKEKVRQVINNMVDNAIKYTKQGSVTMSIEKTSTDLVMKVKDTGRGVDPEIAPTLFSKYTRGKDAATAATGLGLGLYVAKVIIEQNHGKIWVESEGEGKGSTFIFSLPLNSDLEETAVVDLAEAEHK